jgi:nucleotidyltransferase substrate binding protein (TIGR01987 family)
MTNESLDVNPLARAILRLDEGWQRYQRDISDAQIRDGLIQRFEFTYEISHKMLKRYLEYVSPTPTQYDSMSFADLIRSGNEQGLLLGTWPEWKRYRDMRAKTSHTYNEDVALDVVAGIESFLAEARYLLAQLNARPHDTHHSTH